MKPRKVAKPSKTHPIVSTHFMFVFLRTQARTIPTPVMMTETNMTEKNASSTLLRELTMEPRLRKVVVRLWSLAIVWLLIVSTLTVTDDRLVVNVVIWFSMLVMVVTRPGID